MVQIITTNGGGGGGSGGCSEWGCITGTLCNQTDLQSALNCKADCSAIPTDNCQLANSCGYTTCTGTVVAGDLAPYAKTCDLPDFSCYQTKACMVCNLSGADDNHYPSAKAVSDALQCAGAGDMLKSIYDPCNHNADAFDYCNFTNTPTIPTDNCQLSNSCGYITSSALSGYAQTCSLCTVATSGKYCDLSGTPTIPIDNCQLGNGCGYTTCTGTLTASNISNTAYGSSWDGVTTTAPSKNAVYDKISAMDTTISGKQDTLVNQTNIKSINNNSLLGSGNLTLNDVKVSATAPSSPTEGMLWYNTTNDQLKVYDGTNWNVTGKEYREGSDIFIEGGELPSGYTQLEYAQSDGTFGINTGWLYDGTSELKLEARFMGTAYNGGGAAPFGLQNVGYSNWIYPFYGENSTLFTYWGNLVRWQEGYYHLNKIYTIRFATEGSTFYREVNSIDDVVNTYDKTAVSTTSPLFIFSGGVGTTVTNAFAGRIYSLRIWKGGVLDMNLIPAKRNSDNAIGMYDVVGNNFFTNAALVAGPTVTDAYSISAMGVIIDDGTSTVSRNPVMNNVMTNYVNTSLSGKQDTLVSGTNIKTVNSNSLLGSGNISLNEVPSGGSCGQVLTNTGSGCAWCAASGGDFVLSSQCCNILTTGVPIWAGCQCDYDNLGTYCSNGIYFII